jgi:hypothetical protein
MSAAGPAVSEHELTSNLDRYKKDLDTLLAKGERLHLAMQSECFPEQIKRALKHQFGAGSELEKFLKDLPPFQEAYQPWYSEAKALIRQLLPDRLEDFVRLYEKPKSRKEITYENYRIEDYLQGLTVTHGFQKEKIVGPDAAIPHFRQQLAILKSVKARFQSSLFEIRQLVQADLFDSELDAAKELAKNKYTRAAGALAGVVLERHLIQVCGNHKIKVTKKVPGIGDLNNLLKESGVIEVPQWRFIQHLADIRNLCDHSKETEPTREQVDDLITGVMKTTKTLF